MTDMERINFLAELMNLNVLLEMGADLSAAQRLDLNNGSATIFQRYEFHRRTVDTRIAFRFAVDDAVAEATNNARHKKGVQS